MEKNYNGSSCSVSLVPPNVGRSRTTGLDEATETVIRRRLLWKANRESVQPLLNCDVPYLQHTPYRGNKRKFSEMDGERTEINRHECYALWSQKWPLKAGNEYVCLQTVWPIEYQNMTLMVASDGEVLETFNHFFHQVLNNTRARPNPPHDDLNGCNGSWTNSDDVESDALIPHTVFMNASSDGVELTPLLTSSAQTSSVPHSNSENTYGWLAPLKTFPAFPQKVYDAVLNRGTQSSNPYALLSQTEDRESAENTPPGPTTGDSILSKHAQIRVKEKDNSIDTAQRKLDACFTPDTNVAQAAKRVVNKHLDPMCFKWRDTGSCFRGDKCRFASSHITSVAPTSTEPIKEPIIQLVPPPPKEKKTGLTKLMDQLRATGPDVKTCDLMHKASPETWYMWWVRFVMITSLMAIIPLASISVVNYVACGSNHYCRGREGTLMLYKTIGTIVTFSICWCLWFSKPLIDHYFCTGSRDEYAQTATSAGFIELERLSSAPLQSSGYSPMATLLGVRSKEKVEYDETMRLYLQAKEGVIRPTAYTITRFSQELQQHFADTRSLLLIFNTARVYHQEMEYLNIQGKNSTFVGSGPERL
jgi:hypothetical protein